MPPALRLLAWFGIAAILLAPGAAGANAVRPPVAVAADMVSDDAKARIVLVASREVETTSFLLEKPERAVVELPTLNCQLPPDGKARRPGLVSGFRCGLFALGRTRLIIDLAQPATITGIAWVDGPVPGVKHLVIELAKTDRETFRRQARSPGQEPETTGSLRRSPQPGQAPLVAIDAGHGGQDSGAIATTGAYEKDVALAFARALRDRLVAGGRVRVMMIRDGDVFVPLDDRVRIARAQNADLFVSIHGDSMSNSSGRGATIYTGADRATDIESAKLAERENAADSAAGQIPAEARAGVTEILHDLTIRETRGLSHRLAGQLHGDLSPVMRFTPQPHREAGFRVLRAPDMTSVLVELGYLSNAQDASLLLSDNWRSRSAGAMAEAIERFFGPRLAERAAVSP